nr:MAG TPA: hypothetical protein [Caudoviricetes sp.]
MGTLEVTIMADTTWTPYAVEMTAENAKKALVAGLRVAQTPGILLADGQGGVRTALPGDDYGYPLLQGNGPPSAANVANVGQHYFDMTASRPPYEYICVGYTEAGFVWRVYGDPGAGFYPKGRFLSLDALLGAIEAGLADAPSPGDAYFIGEDAPYDVYFYDGQTLSWVNLGPLGGNGSTATGIPPHGAAGQFLIKKTAADYDAVWSDIPDDSIDTAMIKADAVTADKIADGAVTTVYTATLTVNGWTADATSGGYLQTVTVAGLLATDNRVLADIDPGDASSTQIRAWDEAWSFVTGWTGAGQATVLFRDKPDIAIPIKFTVWRK